MLSASTYQDPLSDLAAKLQVADDLDAGLMIEILGDACPRFAQMNAKGKAASGLADLIASRAWIDAGLRLIQLELPGWALRRLAYDDGAWHCSLSKHTDLPIEIDDTADAHHEVAALAILSAFLEVQRTANERHSAPSTVPRVRQAAQYVVCCDNFAR